MSSSMTVDQRPRSAKPVEGTKRRIDDAINDSEDSVNPSGKPTALYLSNESSDSGDDDENVQEKQARVTRSHTVDIQAKIGRPENKRQKTGTSESRKKDESLFNPNLFRKTGGK